MTMINDDDDDDIIDNGHTFLSNPVRHNVRTFQDLSLLHILFVSSKFQKPFAPTEK